MRFDSPGDARVMRQRSIGPAALMARRRIGPVATHRGQGSRFSNFGHLGLSQQAGATVQGASTGAKAGTYFGPIGTVVGAVVGGVIGFLSTKLFGHANHAQIAFDVATRLKYAEGYKEVAGQYPGRIYGLDDLKQVWKGLVHEDMFPKNFGGGVCNVQSCIAAGAAGTAGQCANCGGMEQWVDDMFNGQLANPNTQGFPGAARTAQQSGIASPIDAADQIMIPGWAPPDAGKFNIKWASPVNSNNPSLVRQLFIDTLDAQMFLANPNMPVYYGTIPGQAASPSASQIAAGGPPVSPAGTVNMQLIPGGTPGQGVNVAPQVQAPSVQTIAPPQAAAGPVFSPPPSFIVLAPADSTGVEILQNPSNGAQYSFNTHNGMLIPFGAPVIGAAQTPAAPPAADASVVATPAGAPTLGPTTSVQSNSPYTGGGGGGGFYSPSPAAAPTPSYQAASMLPAGLPDWVLPVAAVAALMLLIRPRSARAN